MTTAIAPSRLTPTRASTRAPTSARAFAMPSSRTRSTVATTARALVTRAIAIACLALGAHASEDDLATTARVLARKTIAPAMAVEGQNLTVTVSLVNAGTAEARKVRVRDDGLDASAFELIGGKDALSATYATLAPGERVEYAYTVVPKTSGSFKASAASVSYLGTSGRETTRGTSNVLGDVLVYTKTQRNIFTALEVGKYLTLGACKTMEDWVRYGTLFGGVAGALALNWFALKVKKGVAAARRRMAVASLERADKKSS